MTYDGRGGATAADGITIYVDGVAVPMFRVNNAVLRRHEQHVGDRADRP